MALIEPQPGQTGKKGDQCSRFSSRRVGEYQLPDLIDLGEQHREPLVEVAAGIGVARAPELVVEAVRVEELGAASCSCGR